MRLKMIQNYDPGSIHNIRFPKRQKLPEGYRVVFDEQSGYDEEQGEASGAYRFEDVVGNLSVEEFEDRHQARNALWEFVNNGGVLIDGR